VMRVLKNKQKTSLNTHSLLIIFRKSFAPF
jgi:hypothetical protein